MGEEGHEQLLNELAKRHACYVLVTCKEPCEDGEMQVEMSYEGDPALAAYLLEGAQRFIDDQCADEAARYPGPKLHRSS